MSGSLGTGGGGAPSAFVKSIRVWGLVALVLASIPPRLVAIRTPLLEHSGFRQTQTAITTVAMLEGGIHLLNYETPIFGPPWRVPLELPVYQATVALLERAAGADLDLTCRVTSLLYFYASALLLFDLCRRTLGWRLALWSLGAFLFSPFTIFWSRACLIEFAAVAFGLLSLDAAVCFLRRPSAVPLLLALVGGATLWTVKLTTGCAFLPPILFVGFGALRAGKPMSRRRMGAFVLYGLLTLLPIAFGYAWTRHSDRVLSGSPYTLSLTAAQVRSHMLGSLRERVSLASWRPMVNILARFIMPGLAVALVPLGALAVRRVGREGRAFLAGIAAGIVLPVLVFTHVYSRHDYYQAAIVPWWSVMAGCGLAALQDLLRGRRFLALVGAALLLGSYITATPYWVAATTTTYDHPVVAVGRLVRDLTLPTDRIVVADQSWCPWFLYYARRRGFMLFRYEGDSCNAFLRQNGFQTVVSRMEHPGLFAAWKYRVRVATVASFDITFVGDDPEELGRRVREAEARRSARDAPGPSVEATSIPSQRGQGPQPNQTSGR